MKNLTSFQKMIFNITLDFMNVNEANYEERINYLLKSIGMFFQVDRSYLFTINEADDTMIFKYEWCNTCVNPLLKGEKEICLKKYPWLIDQLIHERIVQVEDVSTMPLEAKREQKQLFNRGVKSILAVPVFAEGKFQAFIAIDSMEAVERWTKENIEYLQIIAKVVSQGIIQINNIKKIIFLATHDPLTGLPNRSLLVEQLKQGIQEVNQKNSLIAILFINLDGFKFINDTFGYEQGDKLLKQVSQRLLSLRSPKNTVARTDSDQFIIYLADYENEETLNLLATQIIDAFNKPFILHDEEYLITASMGISRYQEDGEDAEELIRYAYMAMGKAKLLGKNQYQICTTELREEAIETIELTNDLYKAVERNELQLYYQPQVDGLTGEICGVEALLRWNHSEHGFISPAKFIPLAEKTQVILSIGQWVLEEAAAQFEEWQNKGFKPIKISVNFSVQQLNHPNIVEEIKMILENSALDAKYLEIEITESLAMDSNPEIKNRLKRIKKLGITLTIDDFGKEYSAFNRLKESTLDKIKIDMSFVQGIGICEKDEGIVKSVLLLAKNLGLQTVAEGVETQKQAEFLNERACDQLQGYYFYRPMPAHELEKFLQ